MIPAQRVSGASATCVGPGQRNSMPEKPLCETAQAAYQGAGMDLVWEFFSRYQRTR